MGFLHIGQKVELETPITVEWEGDKFNAVVYLNAVTKCFLNETYGTENGDIKLITKVYKSAELSLDGKNKVEINEDTVSDFPLTLLTAMSEVVNEARASAKKTV